MNSKNSKLVVLSLLFALIANIGMAQYHVSPISKWKHIEMLKAGVVLVRLPNIDKKIVALEKAGLHERVAIEQKENQQLHTDLMDFFTRYYTFSEVYFFNSRDAQSVLAEEYEKIVFNGTGDFVKIDEAKEIYLAEINAQNPAGEQYRYNTKGVHIKHLKQGKIYGIDGRFFAGLPPLQDLFKPLGHKRYRSAIINLNNELFTTYSKRNGKKRKQKKKKTEESE